MRDGPDSMIHRFASLAKRNRFVSGLKLVKIIEVPESTCSTAAGFDSPPIVAPGLFKPVPSLLGRREVVPSAIDSARDSGRDVPPCGNLRRTPVSLLGGAILVDSAGGGDGAEGGGAEETGFFILLDVIDSGLGIREGHNRNISVFLFPTAVGSVSRC